MSDESRDEVIDHAIRSLVRALVIHPIAAQAAYSALVREGRAFAATDEGRRIRSQLAQSDLAARVRTAWDVITFGMLRDDAPPGTIPSVLVEALVQAVFRKRFESRLFAAIQGEGSDEREPQPS
jgi:hypothetical protein